MNKRRSVQEFIEQYEALVHVGRVRGYEQLLDKYGIVGEKKRELVEQFKRDAEFLLRSSGRFPK
jgi:hypothetical protein